MKIALAGGSGCVADSRNCLRPGPDRRLPARSRAAFIDVSGAAIECCGRITAHSEIGLDNRPASRAGEIPREAQDSASGMKLPVAGSGTGQHEQTTDIRT